MVDSAARDVIENELFALAQSTFEKADSMKIIEQTDVQTVQLEWINENPVLVNSLSVDGLFVDDYRAFTANYLDNVKVITAANASYTQLPDDGGHTCVW